MTLARAEGLGTRLAHHRDNRKSQTLSSSLWCVTFVSPVWNAESARIVDFAIDFVIGFVIDFVMKIVLVIDIGVDF